MKGKVGASVRTERDEMISDSGGIRKREVKASLKINIGLEVVKKSEPSEAS